jgi:hypothetical protein
MLQKKKKRNEKKKVHGFLMHNRERKENETQKKQTCVRSKTILL